MVSREKAGLDKLDGKKVFAFSAIANPAYFSELLISNGAIVVSEEDFADHHSYSAKELENIGKEAKRLGAELIVTTEKDYVKVTQLKYSTEIPVYFLKIVLDMQGHEESFIDSIILKSGIDQ